MKNQNEKSESDQAKLKQESFQIEASKKVLIDENDKTLWETKIERTLYNPMFLFNGDTLCFGIGDIQVTVFE